MVLAAPSVSDVERRLRADGARVTLRRLVDDQQWDATESYREFRRAIDVRQAACGQLIRPVGGWRVARCRGEGRCCVGAVDMENILAPPSAYLPGRDLCFDS